MRATLRKHIWWLYGLATACVMASDIIQGKVDGKYDTSTYIITMAPIAATILALVLWTPRQKMVWFLWLAGWVSLGIGDTLGYFKILGTDTTPSIRDIFYLAQYGYLAMAMVLLVWSREDRRDLIATLGALIITLALTAVTFGQSLAELESFTDELLRVQQYGYIFLEALFVTSVLRLFTSSGDNSVSFWLVMIMAGFVIVASFTESEMQAVYSSGGEPNFGSAEFILLRYIPAIGLYCVGGMVALHPSMRYLGTYQDPRPYNWRFSRELFIAFSVFVPLIVTTYHSPVLALRLLGWVSVLTMIIRYWLIGYVLYSSYLWTIAIVPKRVVQMIERVQKKERRRGNKH